jgi:hypothetical protein
MSILDKKSWTWEGSLVDHLRILVHFPFFFVAPFVLLPEACETIHLSLNSVNGCKFCTDLHGELGRMAGLKDSYGLMSTGNLSSDEEKKEFGLYADYGRSFAQYDGRGQDVQEKYDAIDAQYGAMSARSAEGVSKCHLSHGAQVLKSMKLFLLCSPNSCMFCSTQARIFLMVGIDRRKHNFELR